MVEVYSQIKIHENKIKQLPIKLNEATTSEEKLNYNILINREKDLMTHYIKKNNHKFRNKSRQKNKNQSNKNININKSNINKRIKLVDLKNKKESELNKKEKKKKKEINHI